MQEDTVFPRMLTEVRAAISMQTKSDLQAGVLLGTLFIPHNSQESLREKISVGKNTMEIIKMLWIC